MCLPGAYVTGSKRANTDAYNYVMYYIKPGLDSCRIMIAFLKRKRDADLAIDR